jgi:energy-coupling factor transporter ATP-binding protein EcfA2
MRAQNSRSASTEVLGVRVLGPAPVEDVYFDLSPGFTALYGLNGAGKTRLLRSVADVLAGQEHGEGYVLVRLPEDPDPDRDGLVQALLESAAPRFVPRPGALPMSRVVAEMLGDSDRDDDEIFALSSQLEDQRFWALRPAGDGTGWVAVPAFLADERLIAALNLGAADLSLLNGQVPAEVGISSLHPLLRACPAALGLQDATSHQVHRRELSALSEARLVPYPVLGFDDARAHRLGQAVRLAEVVTNRELTPTNVVRATSAFIDSRLRELDHPDLATCVAGVAAGDLSLDEYTATPYSGLMWAEELAERVSATTTALLSGALPGELSACCSIHESGEDGASVRWTVGDAHCEELPLGALSDAQSRWACVAIAFALSLQRRDNQLDDLRHLVSLRIEEERFEEIDHAAADREMWQEAAHRLRELLEQRRAFDKYGTEFPQFSADYYLVDWDEESDLLGRSPRNWGDVEIELEIDRVEQIVAGWPDEPSLPEADPEPSPEEIEREVSLLLGLRPLHPIFLFLDEPEAGLHRSAERQVVRLLRQIAEKQEVPVTVATHSPAFLEPTGALPRLIARTSDGTTTISSGSGVLAETVESLGISSLERLALYRTILLVEGRHDEIVLDEFFSQELEDRRVLVAPLHGGRLMPTAADSLLLADFTDHRVLAMVDNSDQATFDLLLQIARSTTPGDVESFERAAHEVLGAARPDEHVFIFRLIRRAFEQGRLERFRGVALSRGDILEYLPVKQFVPNADSWADLLQQYGTQSSIRPFKEWARRKRGGSFEDHDVIRACRSMDSVPADLGRVIATLDREGPAS